MPFLPLHRVATAQPFFNVARNVGAPLGRHLRRNGLPISVFDDLDYYIPSREYWDFVATLADHEGIEDLGVMAGLGAGADVGGRLFVEAFGGAGPGDVVTGDIGEGRAGGEDAEQDGQEDRGWRFHLGKRLAYRMGWECEHLVFIL